jgi:hypothetical protein
MVSVYTKEKPDPDKYSDPMDLADDFIEWENSKIELPISEGSKEAFEDAIFPIGRRIMEKEDITWSQCKERGFDISELADRISWIYECDMKDHCDPKNWQLCSECTMERKVVTFLPEKEEGQDELWKQLIQMANDTEWTEEQRVEQLNKVFTINKKK